MPVIPVLNMLRQDDYEIKASLIYIDKVTLHILKFCLWQ